MGKLGKGASLGRGVKKGYIILEVTLRQPSGEVE